jgi:two-component system, NtrC family, nitrogen regulation sensor histidine kinase NtrY
MAGKRDEAVTFRTKLLLISSLTVTGAVALVTGAASMATRRAFERIDNQRRLALLKQFEREMKVQGAEVVTAVQRVAASEAVLRVAAEAGRPEPDFASFYNTAQTIAQTVGLEFVDVTRKDLTILSSAHWPARFGYRNDWVTCSPCVSMGSFLVRIPMPDGTSSVALAAVRAANNVLVIGGRRLDATFLKSLGEAPGMRAVLWLSPQEVLDAEGRVRNPGILQPIVAQATRGGEHSARVGDEAFLAVPLREAGTLMAVLLAGSSLREQLSLERAILWIGVWVGGSGILLGVLLGWWTTERVTRPIEQLAGGARAVAGGDWSTRVELASRDEIGELARAFNHMTGQLIEQRERALQAERVAAWRELARRLAHELKNPLFPLQITVENLQRARTARPEEFEDIFNESTVTLLEEVKNLQTIIGRFSEFARMPIPQFERIDLNDVLRRVVKLYDPQLTAAKIDRAIEIAPAELAIEADPEQLRRAFGNLVLNAIDAMKQGGTLVVRTAAHGGWVRIEVSDSGEGLTDEECQRLFTPYYTTKQHGTGLGLAIVQGVVSDHHGQIAVESARGKGATFLVDLPVEQPPPSARA